MKSRSVVLVLLGRVGLGVDCNLHNCKARRTVLPSDRDERADIITCQMRIRLGRVVDNGVLRRIHQSTGGVDQRGEGDLQIP